MIFSLNTFLHVFIYVCVAYPPVEVRGQPEGPEARTQVRLGVKHLYPPNHFTSPFMKLSDEQ